MKLIKPHFEILEQAPGLKGMKEQIEIAGRTCYKSNDKITEGSAEKFVNNMVKNSHCAMLEHGTVYLYFEYASPLTDRNYMYLTDLRLAFEKNKYSKVKVLSPDNYMHHVYVTTNYRVIIENHLEEALEFMCEPTEYHDKRITVRFTSDIHFYKDCTRHRVMSWAIESTRFCNYLKEKFGSSISFAIPCWLKPEEEEEFKKDLEIVESLYFKWLGKGWKPEEAAYFLIQGTKAEIIMTGFVSDFYHFFDLRSELHVTGKPLPTVEELVEPLRQEFIKKGYVKYD